MSRLQEEQHRAAPSHRIRETIERLKSQPPKQRYDVIAREKDAAQPDMTRARVFHQLRQRPQQGREEDNPVLASHLLPVRNNSSQTAVFTLHDASGLLLIFPITMRIAAGQTCEFQVLQYCNTFDEERTAKLVLRDETNLREFEFELKLLCDNCATPSPCKQPLLLVCSKPSLDLLQGSKFRLKNVHPEYRACSLVFEFHPPDSGLFLQNSTDSNVLLAGEEREYCITGSGNHATSLHIRARFSDERTAHLVFNSM